MFKDELDALRSQGLYRVLRPLEGGQGPRILIDGREVVSLASNDYLGLASHPVLTAAAMEATERYGTGSGASRLLSGSQPLHHDLEEDLARFLGCEAALVFNSGHGANTGVLAALCGPGDLIISDALNHASIVDGCRLSKAEKRIYKHRNLNDLEDMLKVSNEYKRRWIVTDSVFSMDGDMAPLPGIVELAERYGAFVYVDEAHATGVVGPQGRGSTAHFRLAERITLRMGTLGKALGSFGAFVAGDREIIEVLINRARPFIYSTSLPPSVLAASRAAVALIQTAEGERLRRRLEGNMEILRGRLSELGIYRGEGATPIFPVILGSLKRTAAVADALFEEGVFAPAIRPPTVPEGTARLRLSVMATHTGADLSRVNRLLEAIISSAAGPE